MPDQLVMERILEDGIDLGDYARQILKFADEEMRRLRELKSHRDATPSEYREVRAYFQERINKELSPYREALNKFDELTQKYPADPKVRTLSVQVNIVRRLNGELLHEEGILHERESID